jgi:F-type H+-transporting ATPase subunit alpha
LYAANKGFLDDIPVNQVLHFEAGLHHYLKDKCADLLSKLEKDKAMDKDAEAEMVKAIEAYKKSFV